MFRYPHIALGILQSPSIRLNSTFIQIILLKSNKDQVSSQVVKQMGLFNSIKFSQTLKLSVGPKHLYFDSQFPTAIPFSMASCNLINVLSYFSSNGITLKMSILMQFEYYCTRLNFVSIVVQIFKIISSDVSSILWFCGSRGGEEGYERVK